MFEAPALRGWWAQRGYGRTILVDEAAVTWFDTTDVSRVEVVRRPLETLDLEFDRLTVDGDRMTFQDACGISRYAFDRMDPPAVPAVRAGESADPVLAFDVFWQTFHEQFAFFDRRGVDWDAVRADLGPRVHPGLHATDLWDLIVEAIRRLGDGHVRLEGDGRVARSDVDNPKLLQTWWTREHGLTASPRGSFDADVLDWIVHGSDVARPEVLANEQLVTGFLGTRGDVGYLATLGMGGFSADPEDGQCAEVVAAHVALDDALARLDGVRAMVVDARFNGGGWDSVAMAIAGRFADRARVVFTKRARDRDGWTDAYDVPVERPAGHRTFDGPVALLTSGSTASAAEVLVMAMRELPAVTVVGTDTEGITSDQLEKRLPNGWTVLLSNEHYRAPDGTNFERTGIPPDVRIDPRPGEPLRAYLVRVLEAGLIAVDL